MNKSISKYYTLLVLVFVFAAPGVAAYLVYTHPSWLGNARTNNGHLISQTTQLTSLEKKDKWRLILWTPTSCSESCLQQLDRLARVRLALGRKLYLVEQMLLVDKNNRKTISDFETELKSKDFKIQVVSVADKQRLDSLTSKSKIFIMDPDNYLVLSYSINANSADIYKDLKLLLTTIKPM